jgi:exonuclease III
MIIPETIPNRIARRAGKQGARPADTARYAVEKSATVLKNNTHFLKPTQKLLISSFNTRTLNGNTQLNELTASASHYQHDIVCVQEHRFFHDNISIKQHPTGNSWTLFTSSATKNNVNASIGGVGFLLSPKAQHSLNNIESISPRIIVASFRGNPKSTIICCYSPTNVAPEEEVERFYQDLSSIMRQIPKHNVTILGGDFNAKLGHDKGHTHSFQTETNRNGSHLIDFLNENKMICINTKFQKRRGKKWTFSYPNGVKAQIDFLLINKKWKNSAINCEAFNSFTVDSDHRIVTATLKLKLRANKKKPPQVRRHEWSTLRDENTRNLFRISLNNRFATLQEADAESTTNSAYQNFEHACAHAAEETLPSKEKSKHRVPWETDDVIQKRADLKKAAKLKNLNPCRANRHLHRTAQADLKEAYENERASYIQGQINEITNASINKQSAKAWKVVNEISGRKSSNRAKLKASDDEERLEKWKQHFQNLLGKTPTVNTQQTQRIIEEQLDIRTGLFTMDELHTTKKQIKRGKASGLDNIPTEVWMTGDFDNELLNFCNSVYQQDQITRWVEGCILPFPKKGDLGLPTNYRGITLTAIAAKIYNLLLLNRIRPKIDPILRKNQNGFRQNRSTVGQILTIRRIIEGVRAKNLTAVLLFVDFSKAFDTIHRGKLEEIMLAYGIPRETVSAVMMLYRNSRSMVRSPDGDTEFFDIIAGVLQGDTLAPFLFILCLDYALRISADSHPLLGFTLQKARSSRYPAKTITDVDYADDLALLSDTISDANRLLHLIETAASEIGLHINAGKTEYISYNQQGVILSKNNKTIKSVNEFVYLGSNIQSTERDIEIRKAKAWAALDSLSTVWKSTLSEKLKKQFFRATVESVLLYGSTTWTLTKQQESSLDGTYTRMLRAALNVSWKRHPTNQRLYGNTPRVTDTIRDRRLRLAGHLWRNKAEMASDILLWNPSHGKRSAGRPYRTFIDQLSDDIGLHASLLPAAMSDRDIWRDMVTSIRD